MQNALNINLADILKPWGKGQSGTGGGISNIVWQSLSNVETDPIPGDGSPVVGLQVSHTSKTGKRLVMYSFTGTVQGGTLGQGTGNLDATPGSFISGPIEAAASLSYVILEDPEVDTSTVAFTMFGIQADAPIDILDTILVGFQSTPPGGDAASQYIWAGTLLVADLEG